MNKLQHPFDWGVVVTCGWAFACISIGAEAPLQLDESTQSRCLTILRSGLQSDEFWPSMHAAEALSVVGYGADVKQVLEPRLPNEADDQRRCGLARELVRAGRLPRTQIMLDILADKNPYGHVHACESLFKVWQVGDGRLLLDAMQQVDQPKKSLMAAAALARWGNLQAFQFLRRFVKHEDGEVARIAAWILARTGDQTDVAALREGTQRFTDPLTKAYFEHALASLGDEQGLTALVRNLEHTDPAVRVYACEFAPDARAGVAKPSLMKLLDDKVLDIRIRAAHALLQLAQPTSIDRHDEWTRDVFLATPQNPRYSEGSVIELGDRRLLLAMTEFEKSSSDSASARIVAIESSDSGRTWEGRRVLQENIGKQNVMSVTLRRLANPPRYDAPLGVFYLVKNSSQDLRVFLRISSDDAKSFGEPILVTNVPGYHVMNNDRVTILSDGRIVVPVASTADVNKVNHFVCSCFLSDDNGLTWARSQNTVDYPQRGAMEPEVLELHGGRLLMHFRTQQGHIAVSESADRGTTWSVAKPWDRRSPESPATLRRIPSTGDWLLIWNDTYTAGVGHGGKRTPLSAAISPDEGRTWINHHNLETDTDHTFAYTSVAFHQGRVLLTYYVSDEKTGRISSRFRSLPIARFYNPSK